MGSRLIFCCGLFLFLCNNLKAQVSLNMEKLGQLTGLPGVEYNDIWGYVAPNGQEYAIIGSKMAVNIVNVSNCSNPQLVVNFVDGSNATWRDFKTYQNYVYGICDGNSTNCNEGLQVINMNNSPPTMTQSLADFNRAHNIFIDVPHARLYVVGSNTVNEGMIIYDLSQNPANPTVIKKVRMDTLIGQPSLNMYIHDVYVENNIAYASHGYSGFYVWDVSDVNNIELLDSYTESTGYNHSSWRHPNHPTFYVAEEVPLGKPIIVLSETSQGLSLDTTFKNPLAFPFASNNVPHNPFVKGDSLYISYYHDGLQVYDVSNPTKPVRVAYYDTYPNNNNSYSSYEGAWGTYPFLPSGCILVSDITHGLFTLGFTKNYIKIDQGPLYFDTSNRGIVFADSTGSSYLWTLDNNGGNVVSTTNLSQVKTVVADSDIFIPYPNGLVFQTLGKAFEVKLETNGSLSKTIIVPPTEYVRQTASHLRLDDKRRGIILQDANGDCRKITMRTGGTLTTIRVPCPE